MKKLAIFGVLAFACAALSGCNQSVSTDITAINNNLAKISANNIPIACATIAVAEGYFANVAALVPAKAVKAEKAAEASVAVICSNRPASLSVAFADLYKEWLIIQAATTVPKA